jgi:hypothetical protein
LASTVEKPGNSCTTLRAVAFGWYAFNRSVSGINELPELPDVDHHLINFVSYCNLPNTKTNQTIPYRIEMKTYFISTSLCCLNRKESPYINNEKNPINPA